MAIIRAIYENGVFRPTESVNLPERTEVDVVLPKTFPTDPPKDVDPDALQRVYDVLGRRRDLGLSDLAARHDEHNLDDDLR